MNTAERNNKVLVALDRSPHGRAALERAAALASRLNAELVGIYVEDEELVRLSGHSFACQVSTQGGVVREINIESMRRQLRADATLARRQLESCGRARSVPTRFIARHGAVTAELLDASVQADYVVVGRSRSEGPTSRSGSTARMVARHARRPVLVTHSGHSRAHSMLLLLEGSEDVEQVVLACTRMLEPTARLCIASVSPGARHAKPEWQVVAARVLQQEKRAAEFLDLHKLDDAAVMMAVKQLGDAIVAIPLPTNGESAGRGADLAEILPCNVVLVPCERRVD